MINLIKSIIWIILFLFAANLVINFFGYEVNRDYFKNSKEKCETKLKDCGQEFIKKGTEGANCDFQCVDPKLIIKKK